VKPLLESFLTIRPSERRKFVLAFLYAFTIFGACVVGRAAANGLFLARVGAAWLPLVYVLSACTVGLLAAVLLRLGTRRGLKQVILISLLLLALTSVALCLLVQKFDHAMVLLVGIYLLAEIRGCLATIQYGILVNELFATSPSHHHATGLLSSAATLAGIVFGVLVALEVSQLGTVHLLYVVAGLEILGMLPILLLPPHELDDPDDRIAMPDTIQENIGIVDDMPIGAGGFTSAIRSPYVRGIATLVSIAVVVGTLIEFQWKFSVAESYATNEDQMTRYFGFFQAAVNLVTGLIQIVLTGKILQHCGMRVSLLIFPAALLASTLGVLFSSLDRVALSAVTLVKGCDALKRSINDPAILMLYAPLANGQRRQAITFVLGIVKPVAEAIAALLIIALAEAVNTRAISYFAMVLLGVWLITVTRRLTAFKSLTDSRNADTAERGSS
jgi:AAA family ATP:ADP antiporter